MKNKNRLIKISFISLILMVLIASLNKSYGIISLVGAVGGTALVAVLSTALQVGALAIATGLNALVAAITGIADGDGMITGVSSIVFNKSDITTANFFNIGNSSINQFAQNIGQYYYIVRNLAIAILLFVLLYIGIRMAISTVAEQEAKYKKMLQNWAISLALVFLLHYIIIITFVLNDALVNALYELAVSENIDTIPADSILQLVTGGIVPIVGWPEVIVYVLLTVATVAFLVTYIKRVITLGFLIIISPLITVTYSIDKMGDGKSQALDTWMKEFIYSVLIQPFHCVIYIVFVGSSLTLFNGFESLVSSIMAAASMLFMLKAEGLIKKIFGFKADSLGDTMKMGTLAIGMATGLFKNAGGKDNGIVPEMGNNKTKTRTKDSQTSTETKKADNQTTSTNTNGNKIGENADNAQSASSQQNNGATPVPIPMSNSGSGTTQPPTKIQQALNIAKKGAGKGLGAARKILAPTGKFFERYSGEKGAAGIAKGAVKFVAKNGATAFGAIAGAGLSDGSAAVSTALAFRGAAEGIEGMGRKHKQETQAQNNQQVFAGAYNDFAEEYRRLHGEDASEEEIGLAIEDILEKDKKEFTTDYERDMYKQATLLKETGEALGYKDGSAYVRDTIRKINNNEIKTKDNYVKKNYGN